MYICIHEYLRNTLSIPLSFNKAPPSDETVFELLAKQKQNNFMLLSQSQQTTTSLQNVK